MIATALSGHVGKQRREQTAQTACHNDQQHSDSGGDHKTETGYAIVGETKNTLVNDQCHHAGLIEVHIDFGDHEARRQQRHVPVVFHKSKNKLQIDHFLNRLNRKSCMIILIFLILCKEKMVNTRFPGRNRVPFVLKERVKEENYIAQALHADVNLFGRHIAVADAHTVLAFTSAADKEAGARNVGDFVACRLLQ